VWRPQGSRSGTGRNEEWEFANLADRLEILRALRREDPARSRELLRESWSGATADERETFTDELAHGLGAGDEDLLERALADRRRATRDRAAALLARLPGSGYSRRMVDRVRTCVRRERGGFHVVPPTDCDEGMTRDAIVAGAHPGVEVRSEGVRAHWLRQLVAATPLRYWTDLVDGSPEDVLRTPVGDGWRATLLEAWSEAAVRQADPHWAAALLPTAGKQVRPELLSVLDPTTRSRLVAGLLARKPADAAVATALLRDCAAPWTPELATAALADTVSRSWPASAGIGLRERFDLLAHRLPPGQSGPLQQFLVIPGLSDAARATAVRALELLELRRNLHAELQEEPVTP
jgi:hypothetical protein